MKRLMLAVIIISVGAQTMAGRRNDDADVMWRDAADLGIAGKGWTDTETAYDRLSAKAKEMVRPRVWELAEATGLGQQGAAPPQ